MQNFQHNQDRPTPVLATWAQHCWRLFTVLLLALSLSVQPFTATIACLAPTIYWQNASFSAAQPAVQASQPQLKLIHTHAPASTDDATCWIVSNSAPRQAIANSFGPDRLLLALGMLLLGAHLLLQYLPQRRLLMVPYLGYPPPTPPPIA
jgi:hypothetical protein